MVNKHKKLIKSVDLRKTSLTREATTNAVGRVAGLANALLVSALGFSEATALEVLETVCAVGGHPARGFHVGVEVVPRALACGTQAQSIRNLICKRWQTLLI